MGFGNKMPQPTVWLLATTLALILTACPQTKAPGHLGIEVHGTNTTRCDDGLKVEVEFNTSGLSDGPAPSVPENENVYGGGTNWVWVKPGKTSGIGWFDDPYDSALPGGPMTVTAWCMRTGGQSPGKSVREFNLDDYQKPYGILMAVFIIRDMGTDPDTSAYPGYTEVVSPAPGIYDWEEWCDLGVPGDCLNIE